MNLRTSEKSFNKVPSQNLLVLQREPIIVKPQKQGPTGKGPFPKSREGPNFEKTAELKADLGEPSSRADRGYMSKLEGEGGYPKLGFAKKRQLSEAKERLKLPFKAGNEVACKAIKDFPMGGLQGGAENKRFALDKKMAQTIDVSKNERKPGEQGGGQFGAYSRREALESENSRKLGAKKGYGSRDKRASYSLKRGGGVGMVKGGPILEFGNNSCRKSTVNNQLFGDFRFGDRPKQILKARKLEGLIEFIVEWEERGDGFKPKNSVITNLELKHKDIEFLVNFYEGRLIFPDEFLSKRAYRPNRGSAGSGSRGQSYHSSHKKVGLGSGMKTSKYC